MLTYSDKALKAKGDNSILIATSMYSDPMNFRTVRIIVESGRHLEEWHGLQNKKLRSACECQAWLTSQATGELFVRIEKTLFTAQSLEALERCDIVAPLLDAQVGEHNDHRRVRHIVGEVYNFVAGEAGGSHLVGNGRMASAPRWAARRPNAAGAHGRVVRR